MTAAVPGSQEWLDLVIEDVVDPDVPIVDPHHHLWPAGGQLAYSLADLHADTASGHRVVQTVFVECHAAYRTEGDPDLAPLGETEFVATTALGDPARLIAGIVAHTDLRSARLDEMLSAHELAGQGLFRGIRDALSWAEHPEALMIPGRAPQGLGADPAFRAGVARLGERGLTYDTWQYHYQNRELLDLARAVPGTTIVLDHFGTPLGVGPYTAHRDEILQQWRLDITDLATCPNIVAKIGGLAMPDNGFGWHQAERPPTSADVIAAQGDYYRHTIDAFGPQRCMFESNFPVDRFSLSYRTFWNVAKQIAASYTTTERTAMLSGTARRIYRLADPVVA